MEAPRPAFIDARRQFVGRKRHPRWQLTFGGQTASHRRFSLRPEEICHRAYGCPAESGLSVQSEAPAHLGDTTDSVTAGKDHPSIQLLRKAIRIAGEATGILKAMGAQHPKYKSTFCT